MGYSWGTRGVLAGCSRAAQTVLERYSRAARAVLERGTQAYSVGYCKGYSSASRVALQASRTARTSGRRRSRRARRSGGTSRYSGILYQYSLTRCSRGTHALLQRYSRGTPAVLQRHACADARARRAAARRQAAQDLRRGPRLLRGAIYGGWRPCAATTPCLD